jgi:cellobiose-specific phosphotransferase system component IIC
MKDITPILEKLADKLGVAAEVLWVALLKQAKIYSVTYILIGALLIFGAIWLAKFGKTISHKVNERDWAEEVWFAYMGAVCILGIMLLAWICDLSRILAGLFNPEYWALSEILKGLK